MNIRTTFALSLGILCLSSALHAQQAAISTPRTSLVLRAKEGEKLQYVYYGPKLQPADLQSLQDAPAEGEAYPAYGLSCPTEQALAVQHSDGNLTLDLAVSAVRTEQQPDCETATVTLRDKVYPFRVDVCYKAWKDVDVIETWTEISHDEKKPVTLLEYASACLPIRRGDVWLSHLYGSWANEGRLCQEPLAAGMKVIQNKDGVRNTHTAHPEVMFSLDGRPSERHGRVIGAALCYSGNYRLRIDTHDDEHHHFYAGIHPDRSAYVLKRGEVFATPALALTFSQEGLGGSSRSFHRWARNHRLAHGNRTRKILLNSWEGVYFDINEAGMDQMMEDIAGMGGELFVMDDGWFGGKYQRLSDNSSLGDWTVDTRKLPGGIAKLTADARRHGIGFGIWIEPEMTNTTSELYEKHPEWVLKAPGRDPVVGRGGTQLVLDLSNPEVQDFIYNMVDTLVGSNPGIEYIKWDANMSILNHGSQYLPMDKQSHLYLKYHRGLESVCRRIRAKYPDLTIQACASGGGRANYGLLPYFDEFWVSDNTDALQRIYMQWGTSYFYPAIAMASHISAAPNHQTFRTIPLKFRIDVAMSGRLGMEIQPKNLTDEEKALCRNAIAQYKEVRPVVQFGDLYRLLSPYDNRGAAALMYVSGEKDRAVFYWWKTEHFVNQHLPRVTMDGLDPERLYRVTELNRIDNQPLPFEGKTFSGAYLMNNGLEIPYNHRVDYHKQCDYSSRVLRLEAVQ